MSLQDERLTDLAVEIAATQVEGERHFVSAVPVSSRAFSTRSWNSVRLVRPAIGATGALGQGN